MPRSSSRRLAIAGHHWGQILAVDVIQHSGGLQGDGEPMSLGLRVECCTSANEHICQRSQQCGPSWAGIYMEQPPRGTYTVWVENLRPKRPSAAPSSTSFQVRLSLGDGLCCQQRFSDISDADGPRKVFEVTTPTSDSWQLWKILGQKHSKSPSPPGLLGSGNRRPRGHGRLRMSPDSGSTPPATPARKVSFRKTRSVMLFEVSPQERMQKQKAWESVARNIVMERLREKMQAAQQNEAAMSAAVASEASKASHSHRTRTQLAKP